MAVKPTKKAAKAADLVDVSAWQLTPEDVTELSAIQKGSQAPTAKSKQSRRQESERFVLLTETGAKGFEALGCSAGLVWFEILYRVWKAKKTTIELPNKTLAEMGVSRWAKSRAVGHLERAGWLKVRRIPRKTIQVTLLKPGCVIFRG
jgi:hypothetical protein